ncbi:hypothetical protein GCM10011583_69410 [Streptomyces camponoticapitis]|uniref:MarR family transcriptional regulator n=1 Tax=Streptomyces camponoticapitis TaxID=1616125 RepID=A0ABQ2EW14_9ACTN|nr:hypothetical protein [Streptomyces camponoticapitis]GGK27517.1 hypothetical protein GCM10011583_69410 [Streptomyces camponoticapitis]
MVQEKPAAADPARQGVLPLLEHLTRLGKRVYISEVAPGGLRGLIVRRRDPADRRRHIVELSASGKEEVVLSDERAVVVEDRTFAALDADERTTLYELLQRAVGTAALNCEAAIA